MGAFNINITGVGGHGCERKAKPGEKLYGRCGKFSCPDCAAYDFVQRLKQAGMVREGDSAYTLPLSKNDGERILCHLAERLVLPTFPSTNGDPSLDYWNIQIHDLPAGVIFPVGALSIGVRRNGEAHVNYPMKAEFTHWPGQPSAVVDDMLKNERKEGAF